MYITSGTHNKELRLLYITSGTHNKELRLLYITCTSGTHNKELRRLYIIWLELTVQNTNRTGLYMTRSVVVSLRKHAYSNILKILSPKN